MDEHIPEEILARLSDLIVSRMGLHFPVKRRRDLEQRIASALPELGFDDGEACAQWLISSLLDTKQIDVLAPHLTVGETYFFRGKELFEELRTHILPELLGVCRKDERQPRIWSAGCSTGEEAYSVAILLHRLAKGIEAWDAPILATDINRSALQKAVVGVYREWSFRTAPTWLQEDYFELVEEGYYQLLPHIMEMVKFKPLNLVEDNYPSITAGLHAMDMIFCQNVIMYFDSQSREKVVCRLHRTLADDGWLIVSPSEASQELFPQFTVVNRPGLILFRKTKSGEHRARFVSHPATRRPTTQATSGRQTQTFQAPVDPPVTPMMGPLSQVQITASSPDDAELTRKARSPSGESEEAKVVQPTRFEKAVKMIEQRRFQEAAGLLEGVSWQNDPGALNLLARTYADQGELIEANTWCERALAAEKLNPANHYLKATILQEQGLLEEAKESLRKAIYLDPDFVLAHVALGNILLSQEKGTESQKHFRNARNLLRNLPQDELLLESEVLTARALKEMIDSIMGMEA